MNNRSFVSAFLKGWKKLTGYFQSPTPSGPLGAPQALVSSIKAGLTESKPQTLPDLVKAGSLHPRAAFKLFVQQSAEVKNLHGLAKRMYRKRMFGNFKMNRAGQIEAKPFARGLTFAHGLA